MSSISFNKSVFRPVPCMRRIVKVLAVVVSLCTLDSTAMAQTAVMLDGRVLTLKVPASPFATEGPIWNLDLANQGIFVTGKKVTIPATVNGTPLMIAGSSVLGQDGEAGTGIGAADFDRLLDGHAVRRDRDAAVIGDDLGPRRLGAARSLFSTSEARRPAGTTTLVRDPEAQALIEQNYFQIVKEAYQVHAAVLPADFLDRAGLRGADPARWAYPFTSGGTLKSAGHVYLDAQGQEYFVPDVEVVIELSENVSGGVVTSAVPGNASRPDSFVIGDLLLVFNQDPRFGADVLGLGDAVIPRQEFFRQVVAGQTPIDVIGHMVGDHVMLVQEVMTEFIDPNGPPHITADRFRLTVAAGEARWRGTVNKPQNLRLTAVLIDTNSAGRESRRQFAVAMVVDPLTGGATYDARLRNVNLANTTHVEMVLRNQATNAIEARERYDVRPFRQ